jgi:hypothetical protein
MVVILFIFGKLTADKTPLDLDSHNLKFGCEVLLLFGMFHKYLCFKLIITRNTATTPGLLVKMLLQLLYYKYASVTIDHPKMIVLLTLNQPIEFCDAPLNIILHGLNLGIV